LINLGNFLRTLTTPEPIKSARRRERKMQGLKSPGSAQRFLSTHAAAYNNFNVQRHLISARTHRAFRAAAMNVWSEAVAIA
jgi:putative transposase